MTLAKVREIAVLKLIGASNRTIAGMILQQALGLGLIGFLVGRVAAGLWAPVLPEIRAAAAGRRRARLCHRHGRSARWPASSPSAPRCASIRRRPSVDKQGRPDRRDPAHRPEEALRQRRRRRRCAEGRGHDRLARRGRRPDRPQRLGQEHAAQVPRRGDRAHGGTHGTGRRDHLRQRRRLEDRRPARLAPRPHRLRLPGALPDSVPRRHRQRGAAADAGRHRQCARPASARWNC